MVKNRDQWTHMNDDKINENEIKFHCKVGDTMTPYVLFYTKDKPNFNSNSLPSTVPSITEGEFIDFTVDSITETEKRTYEVTSDNDDLSSTKKSKLEIDSASDNEMIIERDVVPMEIDSDNEDEVTIEDETVYDSDKTNTYNFNKKS